MDPPVDPTQPTQDMTNSTNERATNTNERTTNEEEIFPDEEAIGVDEEGNYSDTESVRALSDSSYDTDLATLSDSDVDSSDPEFDPDAEIVDEDDEYDPPPFSYDVDDPCIDVNVVFSDTDQCKSAVTHHCILNDHAFHIVKKDKKRFRAICKRADKGCKWTFYATTSKKYIGCKVNEVFAFLASLF